MGFKRFKNYAIGAAGMLALVVAAVLATGSGSAVAAQISDVLVTNDSSHPIPVHEQGVASIQGTVSDQQVAPAQPWHLDTLILESPVARLLEGPTGSAIDITSATVSTQSPADVNLIEVLVSASATACPTDGGQGLPGPAIWGAEDVPAPLPVAFPTPLVVAPGAGQVCLYGLANPTQAGGGGATEFSLSGYRG